MNKSGEKKTAGKQKAAKITTWPFYIVIIIMMALYIALLKYTYFAIAFGIVAFLMIIIVMVLEVVSGAKETGYMKSILEIILAVVIVVIFWFALRIILQTNYPIDVVPSCSMLPNLKRGDLVILHGTNAAKVKAPIINVNYSAFKGSFSNVTNESFECVAFNITNGAVSTSQFLSKGYEIGLYKQMNQNGAIVPYNYQQGNLVRYSCGVENVTFNNGTVKQEVYTNSISVGNITITGDKNNSIVVYKTEPQDLFYREGDSYIIHRLYAVLNVTGKYYFLTKGDNNPGLDIQYYNLPPNSTDIQGKVIAVIPYLGYLKLIFSTLTGNGVQIAGCNYHS